MMGQQRGRLAFFFFGFFFKVAADHGGRWLSIFMYVLLLFSSFCFCIPLLCLVDLANLPNLRQVKLLPCIPSGVYSSNQTKRTVLSLHGELFLGNNNTHAHYLLIAGAKSSLSIRKTLQNTRQQI